MVREKEKTTERERVEERRSLKTKPSSCHTCKSGMVHLEMKTLNTKPSTQNPYTPNPKSSTLNPKPCPKKEIPIWGGYD